MVIKKHILKHEDKVSYEKVIFLKNEKFTLLKDPIFCGAEEYKLACEFLRCLTKYDDDIDIFKVINKSTSTEIDNEFLTGLFIECENEIILQRIKYNNELKPTSDLIGFNPKTGKINSYAEIGIFQLVKFDKKRQIIRGYSKTKKIEVRIMPAPNPG